MNFLAMFAGVRARLLTLMLAIMLPIGILMVMLAGANYRSVVASLDAAEMRAADDYAVRTRLWFRGILRAMQTTLATVPLGDDATACEAFLASVLRTAEVYRAIHAGRPGGPSCAARQGFDISDGQLAAIVDTQRQRTTMRSWTATPIGQFRYDTLPWNDSTLLLVYLRAETSAGSAADIVLVVAPDLIDQIFDLGMLDPSAIVSLLLRPSRIVASRGAPETDTSWLPATWPEAALPGSWRSTSRIGEAGAYAARVVGEPDLVVLARFGDAARRTAFLQFATLVFAPLLMLALIYLAYSMFIQRNVVDGIAGIERAALADADGHPGTLAPVVGTMPEDIRRVAEAYNRMVTAAEAREVRLKEALADNQGLMRELHHRVKNSLQVIQSYLALTRREHPAGGGEVLRDAEAKVQVLAVAYRFALTEAGMRPVELAPFVRELLASLSEAARRSNQWIRADIRTEAVLDADRAIPLGLAIVEETFSRLKEPGRTEMTVTLADVGENVVDLAIRANGDGQDWTAPRRTLEGLRLQLIAEALPADGTTTLHWRISAS
jgi:two-component system, sensor histidine kinase PdtaS